LAKNKFGVLLACLFASIVFVKLRAFATAVLAPSPDWMVYSVLTAAGPQEPDPKVFREIKNLVYAQHLVTRKDGSAYLIAKRYGTTIQALQATNNNELIFLPLGKTITVLNKNGQLYKIKKSKETLGQIAKKYYKLPKQIEKFKEMILTENDLPATALLGHYELPEGTRLLLPKVRVNFDTYHFPFHGWGWGRISSRFGLRYHPILKRKRFHEGLDLPRPWGTPVYPARSGRVMRAGWSEGYGLLIVIRHSDGATTRYGHLSKIFVKPGTWVERGKTLIGRVGSTGLSTGPHLHFEVRDKYGHPINPVKEIGRR
jgi:murein DD-endopeptidase MepM/ murein hydrolase activator NlpD